MTDKYEPMPECEHHIPFDTDCEECQKEIERLMKEVEEEGK